jgi:pseudaminic acid cytidylyltransferase
MKVAVIPARGGSKRIPRKNIKSFCGKPIISYSIEAAINSKCFDRVIVSTDDEEIALISKSFGAEVPFMRPKDFADDHTGTNTVVKQVIEQLAKDGCDVSYVCCIYPTAPFILSRYILDGFEKLFKTNKIFTMSVTTYPFPVQRSLSLKNNAIEPNWPKYILERSQDLEELYHDAGQFYWGTSKAFTDEESFFAGCCAPIILPRYLVQDIDTIEDWNQAELMYKALSIN